jgi:pimeloyl-ACP methyl ester carboxylesterase
MSVLAMSKPWYDLIERYCAQAIETAGGILTCRRAGTGRPMILLHGIGSGSGSFVHQLEALCGDFQLIAWDAPGYGGSDDPPGPQIDHYVTALKHLLDALRVRRAVVVGHSLGALIGARLAFRHPETVSGLVLASPAAGHARLPADVAQAKYRTRLDRFEQLGIQDHATTRAPALLSATADAEQIALVAHGMRLLRPDGYRAAARILRDGDLISDVARISAPALVVCGTGDTITPPDGARRIAAAFPDPAPYHDIPEAGHAVYIEAPEEFSGHIRTFAESHS